MTEPEPAEGIHISPDTLMPLVVNATMTQQRSLKWQIATAVRHLVVAVVTAAVIIGGLVIGFRGQTQAEIERQEANLSANLAMACVLTLPNDTGGRRHGDVRQCFTQYGLEPPRLDHAENGTTGE